MWVKIVLKADAGHNVKKMCFQSNCSRKYGVPIEISNKKHRPLNQKGVYNGQKHQLTSWMRFHSRDIHLEWNQTDLI